jgi:hypothetical protein
MENRHTITKTKNFDIFEYSIIDFGIAEHKLIKSTYFFTPFKKFCQDKNLPRAVEKNMKLLRVLIQN